MHRLSKMLRRAIFVGARMLALGGFASSSVCATGPGPGAPVAIARLDCGTGKVPRAFLSDTFAFPPGEAAPGVVSCYLIRHGNAYLLWDAGLSHAFGPSGANPSPPGMAFAYTRSVRDQLAAGGVRADQIGDVAISHAHFDHIGQASDFPAARLLIGAADLEAIRRTPLPQGVEPSSVAPWRTSGSNALGVEGDLDVFRDGSVIMLAMPGHTAGHHALLVRLRSRTILLTGDLVHMATQLTDGNISSRTENRADAIASIARANAIAANLRAVVIVAHDPADAGKLPLFPAWAE